MRCPSCRHEDTRVVDSRVTRAEVRRRRECMECGERFTTFERVEPAALYVKKRGGETVRFEREKLRHAILRAASKGVPSPEQVDALVDEVHRALALGRSQAVASAEIARKVLEELGRIDRVAHDRYAAEYEIAPEGRIEKRSRTTAGPRDDARLPGSSAQLRLFDDAAGPQERAGAAPRRGRPRKR